MRMRAAVLVVLLAVSSVSCGDDDGGSPMSPSGGNCARPAAPANFGVALSGSSAVFTWSAVSGAMDYTLRVGTSAGAANVISTNTTQTSYTWNGTGRGTYFATVEARNACGSGAASIQLSFTTN